jgi:hypothetical protein
MKRALLIVALGLLVSPAFARLGQQTTTVTTQTTTAVQKPDGTYTIIQYPVDKEVTVNLTPGSVVAGAHGLAKVMRHGDVTTINLALTDLPPDITSFNVYALDPTGKFMLLGPVTVSNGAVAQTFVTPMDKFMLVMSPASDLSTFDDKTPVFFRSAVPEGLAVIPFARTGNEHVHAAGENVVSTQIPGFQGTVYNVPLLGIPAFQRGEDTQVKVKLAGEMTGARVNFRLLPRKDGPTVVVARFHELKEAPAGERYVLWAVSPDNKFVALGQIVNTPNRNEAEIKSETSLSDFGLFVTVEKDSETPSGPLLAVVVREGGVGTVSASIMSVPDGMRFDVKYCPWADCYKGGEFLDNSPLWLNATTGSRIPLDQPQRYIFTYTDHSGARRRLVVDCQQNCEVKCVY